MPRRTGARKRREPEVPECALGERLLAIDSASVGVGGAVFEDARLVSYGKYLQQGELHGEKLASYRKWLAEMFEKTKPVHVVVEAPFAGRRANAYVVLSYYMAMLLEVYYATYGKELPAFNKFPAHLVKRACNMPRAKSHEENKRAGVKLANETYGLALRYKENDKTKKTSDDDIADAILLGRAWYIQLEKKEVPNG
jgi:hypothetical protein